MKYKNTIPNLELQSETHGNSIFGTASKSTIDRQQDILNVKDSTANVSEETLQSIEPANGNLPVDNNPRTTQPSSEGQNQPEHYSENLQLETQVSTHFN